MATITTAGEVLTLTAGREDQRDDRRRKVPNGSRIKYDSYNVGDKKTSVVLYSAYGHGEIKDDEVDQTQPFDSEDSDSEDSDYDFSFDEIDGGIEVDYNGVPQPLSASPKVKSDKESVQSEATPNDLHEPPTITRSFSSKKSAASGLRETTPINLREPTVSKSIESSLSDTTPSNLRRPKINESFKSACSNKTDGSAISEATPINFHEPDEEASVSLSSRKSASSAISEATPIRFYESSAQLDLEAGSSCSSQSTATPMNFCKSRRDLMTLTQKQKTQRKFASELFDQGMDEDAERDIVNVYLEASAFSDKERLNLTEDIYSFVLACAFCSLSFWFAIYFILVKYICYAVVCVSLLKQEYQGEIRDGSVVFTKIIMVPVAVAMQEDLLTVYYNIANKKYDALTYKGNPHATELKWVFSNLLRAIDGVMSLAVNFIVMLYNNDVMNIFLSFAALHFLQFIDDVIYELAEKGFFGHKMEQATIACKIITFTRRATSGNSCNNLKTNLDSILLVSSMGLCYAVWGFTLGIFYGNEENTFGTAQIEESLLEGS